MKKKLLSNWPLKIASLLFAFCLWLIVINVEDPTNTQTFTNVSVKFENTEILTEQNLIYEVLENTDLVKSITVYGPRSVVAQLKDEDIIAKADFNKLTDDNTIPIEFYTTSRYNADITRIRGSINTVKLNIENEKTIRLILHVNAVGEVAEGYMLGNMIPDQNQIIVVGAESVINTIDKAVAEVDVTDATAGIATYADVKLYDKEGNLVQSDAIKQRVTSVRVAVEVLATKSVPLSYTVMGTPANGYMATGEVVSDPAAVLLAGASSVLNNISRIEIPAEELNITGQSENMITIVNIKDYLPGNVSLADSGFNGRAAVTVYIEPTITRTFRINSNQVKVSNVPDGFTAAFENDKELLEIVLTGLTTTINQINADDIIGYVDMRDVKEEGNITRWRKGTYETTVQFTFPEDIKTEQPAKVGIVLEEVEE
mgnify:FL=1